MTKNADVPAAPAPSADNRNSTAEMISTVRRPQRSPRRPAKNAPIAQPSSIDATSKPTPAELDSNVRLNPSTVPLMTPLSKPNRKPPIVATQLIRMMKRVFSALLAGAVLVIVTLLMLRFLVVLVGLRISARFARMPLFRYFALTSPFGSA